MLARITSGQSGVIEYLQNGKKSGRELSRDELDQRVNIDGNINITDELIKEMSRGDKQSGYLHITLSFGERELKEERIIEAYKDYKNLIMSAYNSDEYNVYAEVHYPKIKSFKDKKTGQLIERLPHVHMVIPQKNLLTDKALKPFGLYLNNIKYHDSIQESINRKHGLESPYDHQRKYRLTDNSEFISRIKGDEFKGSSGKFKKQIFEMIDTKNIRSMNEFKKELSKVGEVSFGNKGEYLQIKLPNKTKNIRLKEAYFKEIYIKNREVTREKPSDREVNKNVKEWVNIRSHEMKYIHPASPKMRERYHNLTKNEKKVYLDEQKRKFNQKYNTRHIPKRRWSPDREFSIKRNGKEKFTEITNSLSSMSISSMDRAIGEKGETFKGILPGHEYNNMEYRRASGNHELRWPGNRRNGRFGRKTAGRNLESYSRQLLQQQNPENKTNTGVIKKFNIIKKNLNADRLLNHFENSHGLIKSHYKTFKTKDGSARIKIGNRSFNVSDFSTKHMHLDWKETKSILEVLYKEQQKFEKNKIKYFATGLTNFKKIEEGLPKQKHFEKKEKNVLNSIVLMSNYITSRGNIKKTYNLNESVQILKYLQQKELYGENKMNEKNMISSHEINLTNTTKNFKKQYEMAKQLELKMSDLIASKDTKNNKVEFSNKTTGKTIFTDVGSHVVMAEKEPKLVHVAAAMTFAAEKFGKVKINGTNEFKEQTIKVAVEKNLNIIFADEKMHQKFIAAKETKNINKSNEHKSDELKNPIKNSISNENRVRSQDPEINGAVRLVSHGDAPYKHIKENDPNYYVETSDGRTVWGIGLKKAMNESNVDIGDYININKTGSSEVKIEVPITDKNGKEIGKEEKKVFRNEFEIKKNQFYNKNPSFKVNYDWSDKYQKMLVKINNDSPKAINKDILVKIRKNDKFLKSFSLSEIQGGKLDLKTTNEQPVAKVYNEKGDSLEALKKPQTLKAI